ncbi:hypothetical protein CspHIS471_0609630 [Cutaneotrichosporon sp. HIS471]|nr:hypothetical protein CspHIS471_0609630 [Cutaneotrichosporon sp. HIS471]
MSETKLTLYSYFRSSASSRVRTVMNIHNIPHDTKYIHLLKGEQKSPEYSALNAGQSVPTLIIRENALEALLKTTSGGKYCYGDKLTLADVAFVPQMYTVLRYSPNIMDKLPTIKAVFNHVSVIPEFVAADYMHQPDTPDDQRPK